MNSTRVRAYAKVNLTLEIVGRDGGYHQLDSLVASIDLFDTVCLKKRKGKLSSIWMQGQGSEGIPPEKNNALIAAERYSEQFGCDGAEIRVLKNIPIGAGLGGSSADVAGVLTGMQKLYGAATEQQLEALAEELGSDVKFMLKGGYARMQGRGEKLTPIEGIQPLHLLLICPQAEVSAGASYREYDRLNEWDVPSGATARAMEALLLEQPQELGRCLTNDLYLPSAALCEQVKTAYLQAQELSPLGVVMTGSGSAILALYEGVEACRWAKSRYRGKYKAMVVKTLNPQAERLHWKNPFTR